MRSRTIVSLGDAPRLLRRATTATGSVADRMAPKAIDRFQSQSYGRMYSETHASKKEPRSTPGPARSKHCQNTFIAKCMFILTASENMRPGRNTYRRRWGSILGRIERSE